MSRSDEDRAVRRKERQWKKRPTKASIKFLNPGKKWNAGECGTSTAHTLKYELWLQDYSKWE
jgi:hypothetical protein